jgi:hypothetical protein
MSWLSASHNRYIRSFVSHPRYVSMSPNQAIPRTKSTYSFPLATAQPLTTPTGQETVNVSASRRACRMARSRNACLLFVRSEACPFSPSYVSLAQVSWIPRRRAAPGRTGRAPFPSKSCALEVGSVSSNRTVIVRPPGSDPIGVTPFRNGPCRNLFKRSIPGTNDGQQRARTLSGSAVPSPPICPGNSRGSGDR